MKNKKKSKEIHFGEWDQILNLTQSQKNNIFSNFDFHDKISFDFHGLDTQKTVAIVENLMFEFRKSNKKCINLISGVGLGHVREQILDSLSFYSNEFVIGFENQGLIRVCKK
ncbi:hypothetical protein [Mesomycoplasma ovipneumoniae]|uniref:hypothetical protein n=1 Tax=Mesomycoplasma ovipneumoniae TaxID=29562 RepID=UPI00311ADF40